MRLFSLILLAATVSAHAQFEMQESHTTASLRGIHAVSAEVAWASGTGGTVLRTEDGGKSWKTCAVPEGAEKLDFRGVQAFDAKTAVVMSSGPGDLSRVYKTSDGCATWNLVRTNTDKDGFWDALVFQDRGAGELIGDPVKGHFSVTSYMGQDWYEECGDTFAPSARRDEAAFAASNSSVLVFGERDYMLGTGGVRGSRVIFFELKLHPGSNDLLDTVQDSRDVPMASGSKAAGIFSLGMSDRSIIVAVGGNYEKSSERDGTAAFSLDGGKTWTKSQTMPGGYRSSVAYDSSAKVWITVGPNGTDISHDHGRDWQPLRPGKIDKPDADVNWNALSLPFVVGPKGRIGRLRPDALAASAKK